MKDYIKGNFPYYCSEECYLEAYPILEKLWQKHNHNEKETWEDFQKNFLFPEKFLNKLDHKAIEIKDGKKVEYR